MGWCGSSTPWTPESQTMNEEGHKCEKGILANYCEAPILKGTPLRCPFQVEKEPSSALLSDGEAGQSGFIVSCFKTIEQRK